MKFSLLLGLYATTQLSSMEIWSGLYDGHGRTQRKSCLQPSLESLFRTVYLPTSNPAVFAKQGEIALTGAKKIGKVTNFANGVAAITFGQDFSIFSFRHIATLEIEKSAQKQSETSSSISQKQVQLSGRFGHCSFTYKSRFYVFGGWDNKTENDGLSTTPFFYFTPLPLTTKLPISWTFLNTENATSVGAAACVVTPSGYFLALGGMISQSSGDEKVSTQIFDLNREIWIDWRNLLVSAYPGFGLNPKATLISKNFVMVFAGNTGINEERKRTPIQIIYFLNMKSVPWTWSETRKNETIDAPISRIFASAKGNTFSFGGYFTSESISTNITGNNYSNKTFITNLKNYFVSPDITLPYGIREGAVGVWNSTMFLIGFSGFSGTPSVNVFPLNLETMKWDKNISFPMIQSRSISSFAQVDGSDGILIYGGCPLINTISQCGTPFSSIAVFNMSTLTWSTEYNLPLDQVTSLKDFKIPLINGFDMNIVEENETIHPNLNSTQQSASDNPGDYKMSRGVVAVISSLITLIICVGIFFLWYYLQSRTSVPNFEVPALAYTKNRSKRAPGSLRGQTPSLEELTPTNNRDFLGDGLSKKLGIDKSLGLSNKRPHSEIMAGYQDWGRGLVSSNRQATYDIII
ncbi:hypothetical protein G9A89_016938 [Geosiphon pyriformis]|nr:hypothetical protein G9A89_016938 [Geosiphon pyriformis]